MKTNICIIIFFFVFFLWNGMVYVEKEVTDKEIRLN